MLSTKACRKRAWSCLIWYLILNLVNADQHHSSYQRPVTDDELTSPITRTIDKSFSRFAEEVQSDKSNRGSSYHYIYSKYLSPVRREPMRLLEIGMGCSMHNGVEGMHSLSLWRKYLTNTKVSYVENDAECASKHRAEIESVAKGKVYVGDQEDVNVLSEIVEDAKTFSGYDIIVDDGGHKASQMLASFKVLWQSLKSGGIYVVEDISENYIEMPFLAPGTFTDFIKNAIDVVQCRMKPNYMGPDSPVRREFMEFCAANPMDIISVECMPEACVLVKGKPRTRGLPAPTPVPADKEQAVREEDAGVGGAEEAAADLYKPKGPTEKTASAKSAAQQKQAATTVAASSGPVADLDDNEDTVVLSAPKKGKPGGKPTDKLITADDLDDEGAAGVPEQPNVAQQGAKPAKGKPIAELAADDTEEDEEEVATPTKTKEKSKAAASSAKKAQELNPAKVKIAGDGGAAAKAAALRAALPEVEEETEEDAVEVEEVTGEDLMADDDQDELVEPAAEEEAFTDAFAEEDEEAVRHRKLLNLRHDTSRVW
ncbi:g3179 [Coccomyxa elongata]